MATENPDSGALSNNEEVFEEEEAGQPRNIHRIRANSSIMQLKKILGEFSVLLPGVVGALLELLRRQQQLVAIKLGNSLLTTFFCDF